MTQKFDRIWLVQQPTITRNGPQIDVSPAHQLLNDGGELITLLESGVYPSMNSDRARQLIKRRMYGVYESPETDAFLWAGGDTLSLILMGAELADMDVGGFYWLKYEREKPIGGERTGGHFYRPIYIDLEAYEYLPEEDPETIHPQL